MSFELQQHADHLTFGADAEDSERARAAFLLEMLRPGPTDPNRLHAPQGSDIDIAIPTDMLPQQLDSFCRQAGFVIRHS